MKRFSLVSGPFNSGKTSYLISHYSGCRGYVTVGEDESKKRLYLLNLHSGEKTLLMERTKEGPYRVYEEVFERANREIARISEGIIVLDECGWMEVEGRCFYPSLVHIKENPVIRAVLGVRRDRLQWYLSFFGEDECEVIVLGEELS